MSDEMIITVKNLCKIYRLYDKPVDRLKESLHPWGKRYSKDFYSLNNVSFAVRKGETIGIIGKNGAGKSTLLKILTGVLTPSSGEVKVAGKISALLELGAGFNMEMTGMENIYLLGTIMGYSKQEIENKVEDILAFADIGDFIYQKVKMYSSGMFARLAFSVSVNVDPDILIVDEALSVGDIRFQIKCMNKMKKMMEGGTTVLFVSHDTNIIRKFCTKALWFDQGRLMAYGETNQVVDKYLEYSSCGMNTLENKEEEKKITKSTIPKYSSNDIARIVNFTVYNRNWIPVKNVTFNEPVYIEVIYQVFDDKVKNPVLGVAINNVEDDYVCGLNTLLDGVAIPWEKGENRVILEYCEGIRAINGNYYFDAALFEETATVPIQHIVMIEEISIISEYVGEGRYIIPHEWKTEGKKHNGKI